MQHGSVSEETAYMTLIGVDGDELAINAFCATGPGGGVDPTCGKDDLGAKIEHYLIGKHPGNVSPIEVVKALKLDTMDSEIVSKVSKELDTLYKARSKKDATEARARQLLDQHAKYAVEELSVEQEKAVRRYTGDGYGQLNEQMRSCPPKFDCVKDKDLLANVQSAIDVAGRLPEPVTTYRAIDLHRDKLPEFVAAMQKQADSGAEFGMPSFTSTSLRQGAFETVSGVQFVIKAKTGLYVKHISAHPNEEELLQSPKARYKVGKIRQAGDVAEIHLEEV